MANSEIMREYFIRLGYQTDVGSLRRFEDSLGKTSKRLLKVGTAVSGIVATVGAATAAFSYSMRKMYFTSQLAGASVKNLNAMSYAGKQIGISGDSMESMIKNMGVMLKLNPGLKALAQNLGVDTTKDTTDQLIELGAALKKMPTYVGAQFAQQFGMANDEFLLFIDGLEKLKQKRTEDLAAQKAAGNDLDANRKVVLEYTETLDKMARGFDILGESLLVRFVPVFRDMTGVLSDTIDWWTKWAVGINSVSDALDGLDVSKAWSFIKDRGNALLDSVLNPFGSSAKEAGTAVTGAATKAGGAIASGAEGIMDFFIKKGWSAEQSAGIAANLQAESSFNPNAVGDGGKAYGVAQWHPDRQKNFAKWAGHDIRKSTLDEQLGFVDWELKNTHKGAGIRLARAKNANEAGQAVSLGYEIPAAGQAAANTRGALAEQFSAKLGSQSSGNNVTLHQATTINMNGSGSPADGDKIVRAQSKINGDLARNMSGAGQ